MRYAEIVVNVPITWHPTSSGKGGVPTSAIVGGEHGDLNGATPYNWVDQTFTYEIPAGLEGTVAVGQLVWVPFGARKLQGVVVALADKASISQTRPIDEIVERRPWLTPVQIELARWIAHRYLAPLSECVWLMLPPGIEQKVVTVYSTAPEAAPVFGLTGKQLEFMDLLQERGHARSTQIPVRLRAAAESLVARQIVVKRSQVRPPRAKPKQIRSARLNASASEGRGALESTGRRLKPDTTRRLLSVIDFLGREHGPTWTSAVYAATGANAADLRRLERAGILSLEEDQVLRDPLAGREFVAESAFPLTNEQSAAFAEIRSAIESHTAGTFLLHGVTGSGKTEIYLNAIDAVLRQERQAIALVPEIALTPQTIRRFGARFGGRIGVVHSELSYGERYDTWRRARDGKIDVLIGPRSALFAPLPRLGLIVVDEEHEPSYKQEADVAARRLPLYHSREVALELARLSQAPAILGSATPDVETYFRAEVGEFKLLDLPKRILGHVCSSAPVQYQDLPPVRIVDLRAELREGNRSVFSRPLALAIAAALTARQQVILFLNRRGTATSVLCRSCGQSLKCPRCNNPFTQHLYGAEPRNELVCHHCGKHGKMPGKCPNCGSSRIKALGLGTEKLEQLVRENFPGARTLRWDRDVTRGKGAHEAILEAFTQGEADVLIGTQMIAKGLDLPQVTVVGVVNADTGLNVPDFRASERTFQLLTQVAGRAGRSALGGQAIIQTYYPEHYAVAAAAQHDYRGFYEQEMRFRREAGYPPFRPIVRIVFDEAREAAARNAGEQFAAELRNRIRRRGLSDVDLVGPAPAFFAKWAGRYRYHLLVRGKDAKSLLSTTPIPARFRIDVDPMNLL